MGLNRMYVRDANAALIVIDKTKPVSLKTAKIWMEELSNSAPSEFFICLCANKSDLLK